MRESPERNEDYFGCIDRSTGTKVHASFMLFCADTIFRTVGARVEIDVWASLSYSHLHWWLHIRPPSYGYNRVLFTINDKPTRISQLMTTVSRGSRRDYRFIVLFIVRFLPLFPRDEQRRARNSGKQISLAHSRTPTRVYFRFISYWDISLTHTIEPLSQVETLLLFFEITLRCTEKGTRDSFY